MVTKEDFLAFFVASIRAVVKSDEAIGAAASGETETGTGVSAPAADAVSVEPSAEMEELGVLFDEINTAYGGEVSHSQVQPYSDHTVVH